MTGFGRLGLPSELQRFGRFLLAGGSAAVVNIVTRIAINWFVPYEVAIVPAYLCGMTTAYLLNKFFVFSSADRAVASEYARFAIVNLVAIAQVWIVSVGLARVLFPMIGFDWHADTVAHVIGVASPVYTSYLGHKHFSFSKAG
jgi:putative flippase GtrA